MSLFLFDERQGPSGLAVREQRREKEKERQSRQNPSQATSALLL
jgi:hypothetical protein